ncbi:hypothetical protein BD289DRAFT_422939 [Coniella lustricola]|uniref:Uncharacterized protein n=1 Tax=Coniella lustricola TaxID=2025994 RepID=A0A2T3AK05_9PEZI|nr:hypothetical protein BD289DRAFT_422939 [Coniella lustricola]
MLVLVLALRLGMLLLLLLLLLLLESMAHRSILRRCRRGHGRLDRLLIGWERHSMLLLLLLVVTRWSQRRRHGHRRRRRRRRSHRHGLLLVHLGLLLRRTGDVLHAEVLNVVRGNLEALGIGSAVDPGLEDDALAGHDGLDSASDGIGRLLHAHKHHLAGPRVAVRSHGGSVGDAAAQTLAGQLDLGVCWTKAKWCNGAILGWAQVQGGDILERVGQG